MTALLYLLSAAPLLFGLGLWTFLWASKSGQFENLEGAANRVLFEDEDSEGNNESEEKE